MAIVNGNLYLSLPACKMAQKARKCSKCQYESCCGLAERNVRMYARGESTPERFQELRKDWEEVCPIASIYEAWLMAHIRILPLLTNSFKQTRTDRRLAVEEWLRSSYSGAPMT